MLRISRVQGHLIIKTDGYQAAIVGKLRKIPGRRWMQADLAWKLPDCEESVRVLSDMFGAEEVSTDPPLRKEGQFRKYFPYDASVAKEIRECRKLFSQLLTLKGLSAQTKKAYEGHVRRFCEDVADDFIELQSGHVRDYVVQLFKLERSHSYINQAMSALKLVLSQAYRRPDLIVNLPSRS